MKKLTGKNANEDGRAQILLRLAAGSFGAYLFGIFTGLVFFSFLGMAGFGFGFILNVLIGDPTP